MSIADRNSEITDRKRPQLSWGGRDVQAELKARADTRHIPIMVVSGTETRDLGPGDVACVMRKPVTAEQLVAAVEKCLWGG